MHPNFNDFILPNGFKVIYSQDNTNPIVSVQLFIRMGSALESDNERGYSHLTEHLVFKSTTKYPKNSIMAKATFLGGSINAFTEYESTCFYLTLPTRFLDNAVDLLSELVQNANFSDAEFKSERSVVLEEMKQYQNDPEDAFLESIPKVYFEINSYRNPIIGSKESISSATASQLKDFYKYNYRPNNAFLVVTGDFSEVDLKDIVTKYFITWEYQDVHKKSFSL